MVNSMHCTYSCLLFLWGRARSACGTCCPTGNARVRTLTHGIILYNKFCSFSLMGLPGGFAPASTPPPQGWQLGCWWGAGWLLVAGCLPWLGPQFLLGTNSGVIGLIFGIWIARVSSWVCFVLCLGCQERVERLEGTIRLDWERNL